MSDTPPLTRRELREAERAAERAAEAAAAASAVPTDIQAPPTAPTSYVAPVAEVPVVASPPLAEPGYVAPIAPSAPAVQPQVDEPGTPGFDWGLQPSNEPVASPVAAPAVDAADEELFQYPEPRRAPAPVVTLAPEIEDAAVAEASAKKGGKAPKAKQSKTPPTDKGVNLLALVSIVAAVVSGAFSFVPMLTFAALPVGGIALLTALIAVVLPGFKKTLSLVAVLLAVLAGGYAGYVQFGAPASQSAAPLSSVLFSVTGGSAEGEDKVFINYSYDYGVTGASYEGAGVEPAPWSQTLPVLSASDLMSESLPGLKAGEGSAPDAAPTFTLTADPAGEGNFSCTITVDGVIVAEGTSSGGETLTCTTATEAEVEG